MTKFQENIYNIVKTIKIGRVMTYAEVARANGKPLAYRAVGNALNKNYDPSVPCHRVIRSDGKLGGYNRGSELKLKLLNEEGVRVG